MTLVNILRYEPLATFSFNNLDKCMSHLKKNKIMKTLRYAMVFAAATFLLSSCANYYYRKATDNYNNMRYSRAASQYERALSKKEITDARIHLADAYRQMNKTVQAEQEYLAIVNTSESKPIHKFYLGKMMMTNGKTEEAKFWLTEYLKDEPKDVVAKNLLASCNNTALFKEDTTLWTLNEVHIDQLHTYFGAVEYKGGIVFTGDVTKGKKNPWTGDSYLDLYYSQRDDKGNWIAPQILRGEISGKYNEGPATFNNAGNEVYFTRNNYFKNKRLKRSSTDMNNLKIFKAVLVNDKWQEMAELPFNSDEYSCGHPTLSEDGKTLFFISDMPGGKGGTDIYYTKMQSDGNWSSPNNLGDEAGVSVTAKLNDVSAFDKADPDAYLVNTPANEMFPYMHGNDTLYFASDGLTGLGGLDIFMTYFDGAKWHKPVNLNYPLNSTNDDFSFYLKNDKHNSGYVSSNREGEDKVYAFTLNPPTLILKGTVTVKGSGAPVSGAVINLISLTHHSELQTTTDENGKYNMGLTTETEYKVAASKENFLTQSKELNTFGQKTSKEYIRDFVLEELVLQKPIVLENIYFDFDKWNIRPDAAEELDKMVVLLNDNPKIRIEMGSHCDCRGTFAYNDVLSEKRARSTVKYLISKGIAANRLEYRGYGERVLVNNCGCEPDDKGPGKDCTREEHQKNRRTEFKVIEVKK